MEKQVEDTVDYELFKQDPHFDERIQKLIEKSSYFGLMGAVEVFMGKFNKELGDYLIAQDSKALTALHVAQFKILYCAVKFGAQEEKGEGLFQKFLRARLIKSWLATRVELAKIILKKMESPSFTNYLTRDHRGIMSLLCSLMSEDELLNEVQRESLEVYAEINAHHFLKAETPAKISEKKAA